MAFIKRYKLSAFPDPEVRVKVRDFLEYYMVFPNEYDEKKEYGIVFCISGYGETVDSEYYQNKLCPYISDKYNVISVGVRYHNDARTKPVYSVNLPAICAFYNVKSDYFNNIEGKSLDDRIFDLLMEKQIRSLDNALAISTETYHQYSSFGFMPAIDHLYVLSTILNGFNIDRRNIIAFGTSYGGYIACLMAKYAPHTFSLVIDNSGFCVSQLQEVFGGQLGGATGAIARYVDEKRYEIPFNSQSLWSLDENSEFYFSDAHKQIRSLIIEEHRSKSNTMYCCYHSEADLIAPIGLKNKMIEILRKYNPTYYKRVGAIDIDGELFKTTLHGMRASLRRMFDYSMEKYKEYGCKPNEFTDFDMGVINSFVCLDKRYNFSFSHKGFDVSIDKLKTASYISTAESQVIAKNEVNSKKKAVGNMSNCIETIRSIIDLMPTMREGLEYIKQNVNNGNLEDSFSMVEDYACCVNTVDNAIKSIINDLPENQIGFRTNIIREALNMLYKEYKLNNCESIRDVLQYQVIPSSKVWEEELLSVFEVFFQP